MLHVLFPVEVIPRELDFRLFLAARFARPNRRIWVGRHDELMTLVRHLRGGLYLGKIMFPSFPDTDLRDHRTVREHDIAYVHLDEEGAVFPGGESEWIRELRRRLDPRALDPADSVLTWGEFQRRVYEDSLRDREGPLLLTVGHPRFDLYKPVYRAYFAEEAEAIRDAYGDFVLVNTNFSLANNGVGPEYVFRRAAGYDVQSPERRLDHVSQWAHACHTLANLIQLVTRLSVELPNCTFVVRPHPSESPRLYEAIFRDVPNVKVVLKGPVAPWLLACRALVHDGCTTAIEAFLAEVPVVLYKSVSDPRYDQFLPNIVGVKCTDEKEAVEVVRDLVRGGPSAVRSRAQEIRDPHAYELMHNFRHDAFGLIEAALEEALERARVRDSKLDDHYTVAAPIERWKERVKSLVRPWIGRGGMQAYARRKFSGFEASDIGSRMERIQRMLGRSVKYQLHGSALLSITTDH
jgi:surface carbohydrate biosynthesis protein